MRRKDPTSPLFALLLAPLLVAAAFLGGVALFLPGTSRAPVAAAFPGPVILSPDAITAKAAILYDPTDGRILFSKNMTQQLPLASLTKLMTAQVVLQSDSKQLDTPVTLPKNVFALEGDAGDWGFHMGDVVTLRDLIKIGLVASSNHAMAAAAEALGPDYLAKMNGTASKLGLSQTYFLNPTGLDLNEDTSGGYGSAYDVARLAATFYRDHPQFFELTSKPAVQITASDRTLAAAATAAPLQDIPGFVGAKTGFTDLAGGNLVAVFDIEIGHPLVAVALGSTLEGRFADVETIISAARAAAAQQP